MAQIEAGDFAPTLPNLLRLAAALDSLGGPVGIHDLLRSEAPIQVAEDPRELVTSAELIGLLSGEPAGSIHDRLVAIPGLDAERPAPLQPLPPGVPGFGRADERVARQLGLRKRQMQELTRALWGRGLEAERDRRVAEAELYGSRQVARGVVTAELRAELQEELHRRRAPQD